MGKLMYLVSNDMRNTIRFCSFGLNGILFDIRQWMKESQVNSWAYSINTILKKAIDF